MLPGTSYSTQASLHTKFLRSLNRRPERYFLVGVLLLLTREDRSTHIPADRKEDVLFYRTLDKLLCVFLCSKKDGVEVEKLPFYRSFPGREPYTILLVMSVLPSSDKDQFTLMIMKMQGLDSLQQLLSTYCFPSR